MNQSNSETIEYSKFRNFLDQIIFPHQPHSFAPRSDFHNELVFRSILPLTATAAPRGFLKSTTLARYRPLHRLIDPTSRPELKGLPPEVIILSETTRLAKEHLEWIKQQLTTNPYLLQAYGDQTDPTNLTWNEDEIRLRNGARCIALGYDSQVRGKHPTDIIVDDLESRRNIATEESLTKLKDWFFKDLWGMKIPETHLTVIGTIIARESLLSELVIHPSFESRIYRSLEPSDAATTGFRSLWAERYPVPMLLKLKKEMGTHRFNAEYQNEPIGMNDQIVLPEWIRHHTDNDLSTLKPVHRYMAVDPAFTEERWGDYSAIIILDQTQDGRLFERLAWRKKVALPALRDSIMSFYRHFSRDTPLTLGIEEVAAQKTVRQSIQELDPTIPISPMRPDKDKARRLIDVSRYFEMGLVSIKTESLEDEILNFPMGSKDRVDALVWALKLYEQHHPLILNSSFSEINHLNGMDDTTLSFYAERAQEGEAGYNLPSPLRSQYYEAMELQAALEEFM